MKVTGMITRVSEGEIKNGSRAGEDWQQVTIEGLRMFVPSDLQNGFARGQRVKCEILHRGDKKLTGQNGATVGYEPEFELLTIEILPAQDD